MPPRLFQVDAFTDRPFRGNPAAVCLLDGPADAAWMQALAAENNLAETAFAHPVEGGWSLRWFTPTVEVDLCGHATLATAHVLLGEGHGAGELRFTTRSGWLAARAVDGRIELDFPAHEPRPDVAAAHPTRAALAGTEVAEVWRGAQFLLAVLEHADAVRACRPDLDAVSRLDALGLIVSAPGPGGDAGPDVVSRVFAPAAGIPEDPVTGAAHCLVGPLFAERLGRNPLRAHQASPRSGDLVVEVRADRVALVGQAVTVLSSTLAPAAGPGRPGPTDGPSD